MTPPLMLPDIFIMSSKDMLMKSGWPPAAGSGAAGAAGAGAGAAGAAGAPNPELGAAAELL